MFEYIRNGLAIPFAYRLWQSLIGSAKARNYFLKTYLNDLKGKSLLDIGCGPGNMLPFLKGAEYHGVDLSIKYIDFAQNKYGERGRFYCAGAGDPLPFDNQSFDIVICMAILHHISDAEAEKMIACCCKILKPGGRLVTLDNVYTHDQSVAARYLISKDRGAYVRDKSGYIDLVGKYFPNVKADIRHDLYRIPYTLIMLECWGV